MYTDEPVQRGTVGDRGGPAIGANPHRSKGLGAMWDSGGMWRNSPAGVSNPRVGGSNPSGRAMITPRATTSARLCNNCATTSRPSPTYEPNHLASHVRNAVHKNQCRRRQVRLSRRPERQAFVIALRAAPGVKPLPKRNGASSWLCKFSRTIAFTGIISPYVSCSTSTSPMAGGERATASSSRHGSWRSSIT